MALRDTMKRAQLAMRRFGAAARQTPLQRMEERFKQGSMAPIDRSRAEELEGKQEGLQGQREEALTKQFATARRLARGQQRETTRQADKSLDRLAARVGAVGGSIEKARQQAIADIGRQFGDVQASIGAQEAQAQQALAGEQAQRLAGQEESERNRLAQQEQFKATLDFQKASFLGQMAFQWAEFNENLKTNMINSAVALKDAGLNAVDSWGALGQVLQPLFGDKFPTSLSKGSAQFQSQQESLESDRRLLNALEQQMRQGIVPQAVKDKARELKQKLGLL